MAKVTYVPSLLQAAKLLCGLTARATPTITKYYGENAALMAALSAANVACAALIVQLQLVREYGD